MGPLSSNGQELILMTLTTERDHRFRGRHRRRERQENAGDVGKVRRIRRRPGVVGGQLHFRFAVRRQEDFRKGQTFRRNCHFRRRDRK